MFIQLKNVLKEKKNANALAKKLAFPPTLSKDLDNAVLSMRRGLSSLQFGRKYGTVDPDIRNIYELATKGDIRKSRTILGTARNESFSLWKCYKGVTAVAFRHLLKHNQEQFLESKSGLSYKTFAVEYLETELQKSLIVKENFPTKVLPIFEELGEVPAFSQHLYSIL